MKFTVSVEMQVESSLYLDSSKIDHTIHIRNHFERLLASHKPDLARIVEAGTFNLGIVFVKGVKVS